MRSPLLFLATVAAAIAVTGKPVVAPPSRITLPLAKLVSKTGSAKLADVDRARAKALIARTPHAAKDSSPVNDPITNTLVSYVLSVGVGTPPTFYKLIVDTGSSNTWVGANKEYVPTSSSVDTHKYVEVDYGSGFFIGEEYNDIVTIESLAIKNQGVGGSLFSEGFDTVDGILGVGPVDLTIGTSDNNPIPTVTDNAFAQGSIPANAIGVYFQPATKDTDANGELTFGDLDESKLTSPLASFPITATSPASQYWGIDQTIVYGAQTILPFTAGIVDTGTTLVLLASDAYNAYQAVTGATVDENTGLLTITNEQFDILQNLSFFIGDKEFVLIPNAQIWPRALNTAIGGTAGKIYLIVGDLGTQSGQGLDFINGQSFLERYYSYYDTTRRQVGLAQTAYTYAETN